MTQLVWESTLDDIYDCKVTRIDGYKGQLTVKENVTGQILLDKEVGLSYGAQFGPDVSDVAEWQDMIINTVDGK